MRIDVLAGLLDKVSDFIGCATLPVYISTSYGTLHQLGEIRISIDEDKIILVPSTKD